MVASLEPRVADGQNVDDANEALAQLRQISRERWPNETEAQAFLNVMTIIGCLRLIAELRPQPPPAPA